MIPIGNRRRATRSPMSPEDISTPDRESIQRFVREHRQQSGLTQRQLAELVGCGVRVISEIENGKATLRMDAVNRVLAAFGKRLGVVDLRTEDRQ